MQNELPGASGIPQDLHFAVAVAGACTGAGIEGANEREGGAAAGVYCVWEPSAGGVRRVGCRFIVGM